MKRLLCLLCVVFATMVASAQITWNAKAGLGMALCTGDGLEMESKLVGRIGVGLEKPLSSNWSLMPSLEFAMKGAKFEESDGDSSYSENVSFCYIQVPILAAYRLNLSDSWNMVVKAGPYLAYAVSGNADASYSGGGYSGSESVDIFDDEMGGKRFDLGLDLAVDFECRRYVFGLEFEKGFTSIIDQEYGDKVVNAAAYVTVGYKF